MDEEEKRKSLIKSISQMCDREDDYEFKNSESDSESEHEDKHKDGGPDSPSESESDRKHNSCSKTMSNNRAIVASPAPTGSSLHPPNIASAESESEFNLEDESEHILNSQSQKDKEIRAKIKAAIAAGNLNSCILDSQMDSEADSPSDFECSESDKEKGANTKRVLDCARRPQRTVLTRPRGNGGKRKTYSEKDYNMIINASDNFKRRIIADALGMPWKTALAIMSRYRRDGKVTDGRHGSNPAKLRKKNSHCDPYSEANRGRWGKLSKKYETYLFHLLHFNCAMFATDLTELINREIQRDFLMENEVMPTSAGEATAGSQFADALQHGLALGIQALTGAEREIGGPLNTVPFEQDERFKAFCKANLIHSSQTIRNHLKNASYTRKSIIIEKASANTKSAMEKRLNFAHILRSLLDGEAGKVCLLFQDEMPFYLNQHHKRGISKKGERAVYRGPPTSNMSFRTQLSMAVHPKLGIFTAKQYNPHKEDYVDKNGKQKTKWKSGYGKKDFEDFLHTMMRDIIDVFESDSAGTAAFDEFNGARIYLFYDGAPEHGKNAVRGMIDRFAEKEKFDYYLRRYGCTFEQIKLSPNSPHLNLCEYYNRMLRVHATRERNAPEVHKILQVVQGDPEAETGSIVQNRIDAIHECIEKAIQHVRDNPQALGNFNNFSRWVQKVIDRRGYLNYYEPM